MAGHRGGLRDVGFGSGFIQGPIEHLVGDGPVLSICPLGVAEHPSFSSATARRISTPEKLLPQSLTNPSEEEERHQKRAWLPPCSLPASPEPWPRALAELDTPLRRATQLWLGKGKGAARPGRGKNESLSSSPHQPPPAARYSYPS